VASFAISVPFFSNTYIEALMWSVIYTIANHCHHYFVFFKALTAASFALNMRVKRVVP
jgi:hypothetical protein